LVYNVHTSKMIIIFNFTIYKINTHARARKHTHTHTHTYIYTLTHTRAHTHTFMCAHTHSHTCTHTHTHTHTRTRSDVYQLYYHYIYDAHFLNSKLITVALSNTFSLCACNDIYRFLHSLSVSKTCLVCLEFIFGFKWLSKL
jgi:hypothetical protein